MLSMPRSPATTACLFTALLLSDTRDAHAGPVQNDGSVGSAPIDVNLAEHNSTPDFPIPPGFDLAKDPLVEVAHFRKMAEAIDSLIATYKGLDFSYESEVVANANKLIALMSDDLSWESNGSPIIAQLWSGYLSETQSAMEERIQQEQALYAPNYINQQPTVSVLCDNALDALKQGPPEEYLVANAKFEAEFSRVLKETQQKDVNLVTSLGIGLFGLFSVGVGLLSGASPFRKKEFLNVVEDSESLNAQQRKLVTQHLSTGGPIRSSWGRLVVAAALRDDGDTVGWNDSALRTFCKNALDRGYHLPRAATMAAGGLGAYAGWISMHNLGNPMAGLVTVIVGGGVGLLAWNTSPWESARELKDNLRRLKSRKTEGVEM